MARFNLPKFPKIHPKALLPSDLRKRAQKSAGVGEVVSGAADMVTTTAEISTKIADLEVMVREAPQRVFDAYFVSLDGTVFSGEKLMPELRQVLQLLADLRRPVRFLSTTTQISSSQLLAVLREVGFDVDPQQIITPAKVTVNYLRRSYPGARVFPITEPGFREELERNGIDVSDDPEDVNVVLVGFDQAFTYEKLAIAHRAITENGAELISASRRRLVRMPNGERRPATLPLVTAIETATRKRLTKNIGTPETNLLQLAFDGLAATPENTLFVTDSIGADIRMAKRFGVPTALVLSSGISLDSVAEIEEKDQPHFVLDSLADIIPPYIKDQI